MVVKEQEFVATCFPLSGNKRQRISATVPIFAWALRGCNYIASEQCDTGHWLCVSVGTRRARVFFGHLIRNIGSRDVIRSRDSNHKTRRSLDKSEWHCGNDFPFFHCSSAVERD